MKMHIGTLQQIKNQYFCSTCGSRKKLTIDHIIPRSKGGAESHIANFDILCQTCNWIKGNQILDEYNEYVSFDHIISIPKTIKQRLYGKRFFNALVESSLGFHIVDNCVIPVEDMPKINEYCSIYGLYLPQFNTIKLPTKNVGKYLTRFDPNYVLPANVMQSYMDQLMKQISG